VAAATTSHNRAEGRDFIEFDCGRDARVDPSSDRADRSTSPTKLF